MTRAVDVEHINMGLNASTFLLRCKKLLQCASNIGFTIKAGVLIEGLYH